MKRVSLIDVARHAALSKSTVSLVLRGEAGPGNETRARVEAAAKDLGYRPNPILASLASKHFRPSAQTKGMPIAYVETQLDSSALAANETVRKGVRYASRLGYRLSPFCLNNFKDAAQLSRVLFAQGVQGIILSPTKNMESVDGMKWNLFSVVAIGEQFIRSADLNSPRLNRASIDHFRLVLRCWAEVWRKGYRRIGFVLYQDHLRAAVDDEMRFAATLACQSQLPKRLRVPQLIRGSGKQQSGRPIERWARQHRPEAVIGFNQGIIWNLENAGFRVPEDIAFATLHQYPVTEAAGRIRPSGMRDMEHERIETAIQLLDQQVRHHQYGLDPKAQTLMIHSEWVEGDTLPPKADSSRIDRQP